MLTPAEYAAREAARKARALAEEIRRVRLMIANLKGERNA